MMKRFYGIWCFDRNENAGDWMRDAAHDDGFIAFTSKRKACYAAATEYGFRSYAEAKRKGWVEVRALAERSK